MNEQKEKRPTRYSTEGIGKYLAIAFGWSWLMWATVIFIPGINEMAKTILIILGIYGPFVSMLFCIKTGKNEEPLGKLFKRAFKVKAPMSHYMIALVLVPVIFVLSWVICGAYLSVRPVINASMLSLIPTILFLFLANTLPEEAGWRGYLMDKFQAKFGPLKAVVLFGFIWGAWHAPLFFIPDFVQNVYVSRIPAFWAIFFLLTLGSSFIYLYLYNRSNRSIFMPTLFHTIFNLMTNLLFLTLGMEQTDLYHASLERTSVLTNIQLIYTIGVALAGFVILGATNGKLGIEYNSFFKNPNASKESS